MADGRSFKEIVEARFENELWDAVASFVSENPEKLECSSYSVASPEEAELSDLKVEAVSVRDAGGIAIKFDVVVSTELEIAETIRRDRETDSAAPWFRISCSADLDDELRNFAIISIVSYNRYGKLPQDALSNALVPYIYKEKLDLVAEDFLKRFYPEALEEPMPLPVLKVAQRMGLTVQPAHLSKSCSVFGQVYFADCEAECFDSELREYVLQSVKRGTILYDPNVFFMRNLGCVHNTIIHECVHWDKHRKAFALQKLFNESACTIRCQVVESRKKDNERSPADWMEWQANALAPRILMPYLQTGAKARELIQMQKALLHTDCMTDVMEPVITELADFFGVSKTSAKLRMVDLGYEDAMGVFTYTDDHYVPRHSFKPGAIKKSQTFTIDAFYALLEFASKPELQQRLSTGKYLYVDSHYCLNDPKYIEINEQGHAKLTDYANRHIDECCLVFDLEVSQDRSYGTKYYTECVLYKDALSQHLVRPTYKSNDHNKQIDQTAAHSFPTDIRETSRVLNSLPGGFSEALITLMKWRGVSERELADRCYMEEKTIQRMRTGKPVRVRSIVAVCVGMQLPPAISLELVTKAGFFLRGKEEYVAFHQILCTQYRNSILECNEMMESLGFPPLSDSK